MDTLLVDRSDGVARITLNAPDRLNAVDPAMLHALIEVIRGCDADPSCRVIVITGAGRGFCAGADLGDAVKEDGSVSIDPETLYAGGRAVRVITECGTPVLCLVNGVAAGIGLSIALAADYVLATAGASFMLAFSNIGLMPDGGATALVAASIGRARAMRMALTAEKVSASDAAGWGLIAEVCADEAFVERGAELIERLSWIAPRGTAATKRTINEVSMDLDTALAREDAGQAVLLQSKDFQAGTAAFLKKEIPHFTGE